jgi:hypothetical protein
MGFQTKLDLSQQSSIPTGQTADWKGSVSIGENLKVSNIGINPSNPFIGSSLFFDPSSQSYKSGQITGSSGLTTSYVDGNLFISFTGSTTITPRLQSISDLSTYGIMVNYGNTVSTVSLSGSSDFVLTNPFGITGNTVDFSLSNTGVSGGTYGSGAVIPILTVDSKGRITSMSGATVNIPTNYISSLNGLTGQTQNLSFGFLGNQPAWMSSVDTHTLHIPMASGGTSITAGLISGNDYISLKNSYIPLSGTTTGNTITGNLITQETTNIKFGRDLSLYGGNEGSWFEVQHGSGAGSIGMFTKGNSLLYTAGISFSYTGVNNIDSYSTTITAREQIKLFSQNNDLWLSATNRDILMFGYNLKLPTRISSNRASSDAAVAYNTETLQFEGRRDSSWKNFLMDGDAQAPLSGTGFVKISGTTISYDNTTYLQSFTLTRYAKVDYINGNNGSALLQRVDKPYADLQTCYTAITALGGTDNWIIEIVGDKTIITNELTMNVLRNGNMTLIFQGNITLSIPFSSTSGMFNNIAINNLTVIFNGNLTQTTNIGLGLGNQSSPNQTNNKFIFNGITSLRHGKSILVDNGNLNINGNNNYLFFNNLVIDITNISGATGTYLTAVIGLYTNNNGSNTCQINNLTVQGSTTTALNLGIFTSGGNSIFEINSIFLNQINTNYNSWCLFSGTYNKINITTIDTRTNGTLLYKDTIFSAVTANVVNIENADIKLGGIDFYSGGIKNLNTINYKSNGVIMYDQLFQGVWTNLGTVESTILSQNVISLKANSKITGGKWIFNCDTNSSCFLIYPNGTKWVEFENMSIYNKGITANSVEGCPFFRTYSSNSSLRLKILFKNVNLSGTLNNANPSTTWIKSYGGGGFDLIKIEGDIVTCYNGALNSNIINNCDINYIEDLNLIN